MDGAHLHLVLTHVPVLGLVFGTLLLAAGWYRKSRPVQQAALTAIVLAALAAGAAYWTGEGAEEAVEHLARIQDAAIETHEEAGMLGLLAAGVAGAMALITLVAGRSGRQLARSLIGLNLVIALSASGILTWVANLGGRIGHPEILNGRMASGEAAEEHDRNR